jgi:selenocysteine-specific elongation factor
MPFIIGTAGHIDHGKTALVKALTGQDTDRLKEEKERGISIDLGFAYLDLPDGTRAGVVDVPGHERFIRNMLAGAHGIDLVLFTVAADDGVMPQTEEHLDIVHLLGVRNAIFVVTKVDLVPEARLLDVEEEIRILASGSAFEQAPIVHCSSLTGQGLDDLRRAIAAERRTSGCRSTACSPSRGTASSSPEPLSTARFASATASAACRATMRSACAACRSTTRPSSAPRRASASR